MAKRPPLTDKSFLGHLFSPKRNPKPSGIRTVSLKGTRGGRTKARLASFNRMSPTNQEMLKRAGMREQYLKGEVTLSDAKHALRPKAIQLGVARPVRGQVIIRTGLDVRVAAHLKYTIRSAGRPMNPYTVDENVRFIPPSDMPDVLEWDYSQVKHAGRTGSEYEVNVDGQTRNPFWYH